MPKKTEAVSQASAEISADAALKLFQVKNVNNTTSSNDVDFGDDSEGEIELTDVHIEMATNGYLVTFSFDDGTEEKYIHDDFDELLEQVRGTH